jgi:mannose-1-phosphate guanylyltransferase / mannose-6-phosphate isomerase
MIHPVILSGGSGSRLWPMSRALYPKQLQPLVGLNSLLQDTALRVADAAYFHPPIVVCNAEHRFAVAEQLRQVDRPAAAILLEPLGRNTAPAIAAAAELLVERDPDAVLLALASDHAMIRPESWLAGVVAAEPAARRSAIVTFGVRPSRPETGYGYISAGEAVAGAGPCRRIEAFVEKPDLATAERLVASGRHYWNAGIFLMSARTYLDELQRHEPEIAAAAAAAVRQGQRDLDFLRLDPAAFAAAPSRSIDYAVMERTDRGMVVPVDPGWSDVGSWRALHDIAPKDPLGNAIIGDVHASGTRNCYLRSNGRLIVAIGVEDLVVIADPDAVLVARRDQAQEVKAMVEALAAAGRAEATSPAIVHRPWGHYRNIDSGRGFQVKRIVVNPGGRLSLQRHAKRTEHWVVVAGIAEVTVGEQSQRLGPTESIMVPLGVAHRLANPGDEPLHLVEVQSGAYVGEDDIERLDDAYGRA